MANEIRVQTSLQINTGSLQYRSQPTQFNADMAGIGGPTPGQLVASLIGTDVDLSELEELGGLCRIQNLDDTNFVTYGIFDFSANRFYPLGEMLPGESYVLRLSREIGVEYGTGTGSAPLGTGDTLRIKADTAPCKVLVEAFER